MMLVESYLLENWLYHDSCDTDCRAFVRLGTGIGSPGLVVMGGVSCSEGRGFESRRRNLDGPNNFPHILVVRIVMFV